MVEWLCGLDVMQYLFSMCVFVPEQLVFQARLGHSEIDDCNFDTHLKCNRNPHKFNIYSLNGKSFIYTATIQHQQ